MKYYLMTLTAFVFFLGSCKSEAVNLEDIENETASFEIKKVNDSLLIPNLETVSQKFDFFLDKDTILVGEQGTKLFLKLNTFSDTIKKVYIELKEVFSIHDMIANGLTTFTDDGNVLITQGMIYLSITADTGEEVNIQNPIRIDIPSENKDLEMLLYEGKRNENGNVVWINEPREFVKPKQKTESIISVSLQPDTVIQEKSSPIIINDYYDMVYSFSTRSMGWHNIDKPFYSSDFIECSLQSDDSFFLNYVVYKDFTMIYNFVENVINQTTPWENRRVGKKIIANTPFYFVRIRRVSYEDDRLLFYIGEHKVNQKNNIIEANDFDTLTVQEIEERLLKIFGGDVREEYSPIL